MVGFFSFSLGKGSKMRRILGKPKLKEKRRKKGIYSVFQELSPPLEKVDFFLEFSFSQLLNVRSFASLLRHTQLLQFNFE
jgi:hypothetical protein